MKKKVMPLAVGAVIAASAAQAQMYINNDGMGEILVYPFYSAESGNTTNVNLTNTFNQAKAVKVRIIEGENSQEVLDFNVYMSAEDHFSFAITATADGGGSLVTYDNTCTVPRIAAGEAIPFRNFLFTGDTGKDDPATEDKDESFDNSSITRTATGYIEVIEMGQLDDTVANWDDDADTPDSISPMLAAITHGADGVPADCDLPVAAWSTGGAWHAEAGASTPGSVGVTFMEPYWLGGGLYGEAAVVNVADATAFGEDAVAIESAVAPGETGSVLHYPPGDTRPDFTSPGLVDISIVEVDGVQLGMVYGADLNDASLKAVSSLFMTEEVINDFVTDPGIAASTDWIITMPTKFQHIGRYVAPGTVAANPLGTETLVPFSTPWNKRTACEYATLYNWDREEANPEFIPDTPDFSPAPDIDIELYDLPLCYEVNVVQFGDTSAVGNESLAVGIADQLVDVDGWAKIDLSYDSLTDDGKATVNSHQRFLCDDFGDCLSGLPVTGFAVQKYGNNNVNGSGNVANYTASFEHRTQAAVSLD